MKILVICQYYYPENFQITPICEQLVEDGHEVTVLTGLPNYPTGIVPKEYKHGHRKEIINGVNIIRCYEIGRKKGAISLALNYLSFWISSIHKIRKMPSDFDVVFVYQLSPVMMGIAGRKYAKRYHKPLFLYCCDLWPESVKMYIKNESNIFFKFAKKISQEVYSSCDKIACQSDSFLPYIHETHNVDYGKLVYIPAFADDEYLSMDFNAQEDGCVDFVFMGNLGIAQDLMSLLKAVEKIKDIPNFKVHFVGDGICLSEMKAFVNCNGLEKVVKFYGRRPVEEMPRFYRLADACLVSLKSDNKIGLTLPAKVQGYMAAGKPIIGMINGAARRVILEAQCGFCVESGQVDCMSETMKSFISDYERESSLGDNGREYFKKHFRKKIIIEKIEKELIDLLNGVN